jgi:hypothetical protein
MHTLLRSLPRAAFKRTLPLSGSRCLTSSSPSPNSCLILGATSSISFEVVRHLLARGVRVLATGRDESRLKELQDMGASTMQAGPPCSGACMHAHCTRLSSCSCMHTARAFLRVFACTLHAPFFVYLHAHCTRLSSCSFRRFIFLVSFRLCKRLSPVALTAPAAG